MSRQYIFQVEDLTKKHGQKTVLNDIWLAFYPGAKIGVLGPNGAGKSTLLRIMAGQDTDFEGTARLTAGFTAGYLPQEPPLDDTKTVFENVQVAVAERQAILDKEERIYKNKDRQTDAERLNAFIDIYFDYAMLEFPEFATFIGHPVGHDRWTDQSIAAIERRKKDTPRALKTLKLGGNGVGLEGMLALTCSDGLSALETLSMRGNRVGATGVEALARAPNLRSCRLSQSE